MCSLPEIVLYELSSIVVVWLNGLGFMAIWYIASGWVTAKGKQLSSAAKSPSIVHVLSIVSIFLATSALVLYVKFKAPNCRFTGVAGLFAHPDKVVA
jgi:hypothetical protein